MNLVPSTIPYEPIREGQVFPVGLHHLDALHIPGHTLGSVAFRLEGRYLFAGDSIFIHSIARPDLGGKADLWAPLHGRSLRRLLALPGRMTVLPGHFSSLDEQNEEGIFAASLDDLKQRNDGLLMLQSETEDGFVRYLLDSLPRFVPEYMDIKRVNTGHLKPVEEDAWALELGKNACGLAQAKPPVAGAIR
jgi:glyoxylase-like metal-dependent hydrolase (beta-lactamase superfamily II)